MNNQFMEKLLDPQWVDRGHFGKRDHFIMEDTVPDSLCDDVISYYEECDYLKKYPGSYGDQGDHTGPDKKVSTDMSVHYLLIHNEPKLNKYFACLDQIVVKYFNEYAFACMDSTMHSIFNIQKYPVGGGFKVWHSERGIDKEYLYRHLVWMTFLTDNPDGGTEFIYQDKYIPAKKGKTLIWPSDWTHTHRGKVDTTKEKMIITGWIDLK